MQILNSIKNEASKDYRKKNEKGQAYKNVRKEDWEEIGSFFLRNFNRIHNHVFKNEKSN